MNHFCRSAEKKGFEKFYAFDSTTITLFSEVMKGVGRNPQGDGKKKGGLKVHMLTDVHADTAILAKISKAKMHDKKFLQHLNPSKGSMLVFDKAYNYYLQFAQWTDQGVYFVCRLKDNAKAEVQEVIFNKLLKKDEYFSLCWCCHQQTIPIVNIPLLTCDSHFQHFKFPGFLIFWSELKIFIKLKPLTYVEKNTSILL